MTEGRKEELKNILQTKQQNASKATASVMEALAAIQATLDVSEIALMLSDVTDALRHSHMQAETIAHAHEIEEYGVELLNIDGEWDKPFTIVDARPTPWEPAQKQSSDFSDDYEDMSAGANRIRLQRFGSATGLLFGRRTGSVEIIMASLDIKRLLDAWSVHELSSKATDAETMRSLHFLIEKSHDNAPNLIVEVPIASSGRAALVPDHGYHSDPRIPNG